MKLIGAKDAYALSSIAAGLAASSPWLAGSPLAMGVAASLPAAGALHLASKFWSDKLHRLDKDATENFTLLSDKTFGNYMANRSGLRFGYTRDNGRAVDIPDDSLVRHFAIIGQSGVGKTTLGEYLLWQQALRGGGFIFIDAKLDQDTRDKLGTMMRLLGREDDFYYLNINSPENSNTYNPVLRGDADEVASRLMNLSPSAENNAGADHYRQSANNALTVLVGALQGANTRFHFGDLSILLQSPKAIEYVQKMQMPADVRQNLDTFLDQYKKIGPKGGSQIDVDKLKNTLGGMSGRIGQFAQGKFGMVFNTYTPEIDLVDIMVNNKCLYVALPTMSKDTAALNLGKIIMSDIRTAVAHLQSLPETQRPNPPFLVFADEMGSYVMPGVSRLMEQARSASVMLAPAFQSFANLSVVSPDFADMVIQNTWNKCFFKFGSAESPETAAEIIGKVRTFAKSISRSESEGDSASQARATPQGSASTGDSLGYSWRQGEDYRVTPDQLKRMGKGECVMVSGPRVFHINTPMLHFPKPYPEYKVLRRHVTVPEGVRTLNFSRIYKTFLTDAGTTLSKDELDD